MKTFKKILKAIAIIFAVVFINGCYYVFHGQFKSQKKLDEGKELNLYECCSIYTMHMAAASLSWIFCPEASYQCLLMQFAKDDSTHSVIKDGLKDRSPFIRKQIIKHNYDKFILNFPLNDITGNKLSQLRGELRNAVAYDGATYTCSSDSCNSMIETLTIRVKYDKYVAKYSLGPFRLKFNFGLLNYIQNKGWLHECTLIYWIS